MTLVLRQLLQCEQANANRDTINSQHIKKQALTCVSACLFALERSQVLALGYSVFCFIVFFQVLNVYSNVMLIKCYLNKPNPHQKNKDIKLCIRYKGLSVFKEIGTANTNQAKNDDTRGMQIAV